MTKTELRAHPGYIEAMDKIKNYRTGFEFHMDFSQIPTAKANGLKLILCDAKELGYLESIEIDTELLTGNWVGETYRRTDKR